MQVRQSRLVSAYAISPHAIFTCPPCSLRFRATAQSPALRLTFCSLTTPKPRLYCFSETLSANLGEESPIKTTTSGLESGDSPVTHLEAILSGDNDQSGNSTLQLLATHQNGDISCYNGSLEKKLWVFGTPSPHDGQVLLANVTSVVPLKKGLLKHREDVLASLGAPEAEDHSKALILLTRASDHKRKGRKTNLVLRIFKLSTIAADPGGSAGRLKSRPQEVVSIDIVGRDHPEEQNSIFTLHVASGTLYQQTPGLMTLYDLTGLIPKIAHVLAPLKNCTTSFLRLSSSTFALSGQSSISLIGLPYCSIQAELSLESPPSGEHGPLRLLSYFASFNIIVAIKGSRLMTIRQLDSHPKSGKRRREGTLVDSIGRGSYPAAHTQPGAGESSRLIRGLGTLLNPPEDQVWESNKTKLDGLFLGGDAEAFFDTIMRDLKNQNLDDKTPVDQPTICYLLSKLFTVKRHDLAANNTVGLEANYRNLDAPFAWLLQKNLLTSDRIERSLKRAGLLHASETLVPCAMINALADKDMPPELLNSLIAGQIPLSPQELTTALAAVTQQWDSTATSHDPKLLTDTEEYIEPMQIENGNEYPDTLNKSQLATTTGTSTHHLLYLIISRFFPLPQSAITPALRTQLTKPHLLHLIDILRIEIARSGWLSPYDENLTPPTALSTPNDQLAHITHLLNSVVDAIGAGGWILGPGSNAGRAATVDNTISYMKAEISAALEGIEEAVYLQGMLGEVLLCGKEALLPTKIVKEGAALPSRNVPQTVALPDAQMSALPLGLKLEKKVPLTKVGAGGELIGRSKRDIGRLKSKMVGKYSFERIIV